MHRRRFLQASLGTSLLASLPSTVLAGAAAPVAQSWQAKFAAAAVNQPWLNGYRTVGAESYAAAASLWGNIPSELSGTLYRNGPAKHEIGNFRWHHWFDGDGMLQAYRISKDGIRHQARMIATPKYLAEKAAGKPLYSAFGTPVEDAQGVSSADTLNPANISVLPHHGKLYALWEAGSAVEVDAQTLETVGLHAFSEETAGVPFSAHPRIEADGNLWNFGYVGSASLLVLWHIDPTGRVQRTGVVPVAPMSMPHDFVVTARHLVIMIPPLWYEPEEGVTQSFLASHRWHDDQPTRVLVIDKNDFSKHQTYELPAQWVFHYGNAWEDRSGVIHFDAARADAPTAMTQTFTEVMRGVQAPAPPSRHTVYRIDTRQGTISEAPMLSSRDDLETEFPCIDPRLTGRRNERLFMLSSSTSQPAPNGGLNAVSAYRADKDTLDTYTYPISQLPEEHLFVPKPNSAPEAAGWVLGSAYDFTQDKTLLNIFNADRLADGPVCTATLPYGLPLGLHGKFVGELRG